MLLARVLARVVGEGQLTIIDEAGRPHRLKGAKPGPSVTLRVHDQWTGIRIALRPRLALGEAYMDGTLTVEEGSLYDLLDLLGRNIASLEATPMVRWSYALQRWLRALEQYNPIGRAQKNVAHHYDLKDELYDFFLDRDRQYSCAYFKTGREPLETAQADKKRHIAAKLLLKPGQRVLDIGSGWGGLGLYLAGEYGVDVTGVTLSTEQHTVSSRRALEGGIADRVRFKLIDYRQEPDRYDRIVSVGMFEHVGAAHYLEFFGKMKELLADDGVMVLHSIGRMERPGGTNTWLRKYIFPGGYTPAMSEVLAAIEKVGLWVTDVEVLRLHYAETLRHWRERFLANRGQIKQLAGYDDRFCRMWEFYLAGCEVAFRYMNQMVFQMQITRRQDATPLTRDYMIDNEREGGQARSIAAE
ncbi:MAG: class I SAM-dependent methyltransferase [Reyranella sp.]|jgi:cyclopropane-fatty-acyl-phospholipid synthase|uniref:SAM-dependent methyltransferase n=1 Tax=Reyranella sp. TaxID=1929291 RepID=UPI0009593D4C|nr:cyclopropane-fatty-acyl-phospholipid synthase family protein [Reyranella sp.]MBN9539604.1 class I SAM-dependent methyltransferase [Alphaproteobacteria bacterium]MBR2816875.1 class I SAM-dependent methyltransferase [Reyranella sp.]OJU33243.1 MAG: cyclopropane-fatty-acyl-phospholipid synthase [Alphaproteobacteria bacterium 65-37]